MNSQPECPVTLEAATIALTAGNFKTKTADALANEYEIHFERGAVVWVVEETADALLFASFNPKEANLGFMITDIRADGGHTEWALTFDGKQQVIQHSPGAMERPVDVPVGALDEIAKAELGWETLELRNSDRLDFHDISVTSVRRLLAAAYTLGFNHATAEEN